MFGVLRYEGILLSAAIDWASWATGETDEEEA